MMLQSLFRRIIDFGSALDEFTMKHYYGSVGPSRYFFFFVMFILEILPSLVCDPDYQQSFGLS